MKYVISDTTVHYYEVEFDDTITAEDLIYNINSIKNRHDNGIDCLTEVLDKYGYEYAIKSCGYEIDHFNVEEEC